MTNTLRALPLLLAAALGGAIHADPATIDRIAAVVNQDVVLASEVLERYQAVVNRLAAEGRELPPRDAIMDQILERLIVESIQLQEATQRGIEVDDETLTAAVTDFAAQSGMDIDAFIETLDAEGVSYRAFRDQVRQQITIERVQRDAVNRRVYILPQDIDEVLASPFFAEHISDEYRLGHILLLVEPGAGATAAQAVNAQAEALVAEIRGGADFSALAVEHSAASTALEGGDLGWRKANRIPSLFAQEVADMAIGDVRGPIRNASGLHIVKLLDQRGASQQVADETLVRHILLKPSAIRSDEESRTLAGELRERIDAGEDFAELAQEFSDDPGSALAGGDLGWRKKQDLVPEFQVVMESTETGTLSEPFRTAFGWHVLQVQDRRREDASDEARRDYATRMLHAQRFEERLAEWLREIRDEAFVEVRLDTASVAAPAN